MKTEIKTSKAPQAIGPYSQAIRMGNMLFASGQIPLVPETGELVSGDIEAQTTRVMQNIVGLLESQGLTVEAIVKSTVFLKNMGDFPKFNATYEKFLKAPYPARSTVEVAKLPRDVSVEIEIIAHF